MAITSVNNRELLFRKSKSKGSGVKDWISKLPDELLCKILSSLTTKDSTRTSVLSKRWRNLWTSVPALDLNTNNFEDDCDFWEFFDSFLESNVDLGLNRFKLIYNVGEHFHSDFASRIDDVVKRRVCCLTVVNRVDGEEALVRMPLSLYSCATLVNLELYCVFFDAPKSALVSLPSLKSMTLKAVKFDGNEFLEILISSCSVLEELVIVTHLGDNLEVICVRSQSLNSFELESTRGDYCDVDEHPGDPHLVIDAPRLDYMSVRDYQTDRFIIINIGPSAKVQLDFIFDVEYDDPSERTMMSNFLTAISTVDVMSISARTVEMINDYRELEALPQFVNLSFLHAFSLDYSWEALQTFLGFCPNLQSLNVDFECLPEPETINLSYVPQCFMSSLEFVELRTLVEASEKKLATYFLRNCVVLKKLMLTESFGNIMKKIKGIPKRSRECEVVMLESDDDSD